MKCIVTILFLLLAFIANTQNTFIINYERSINPFDWEEAAECIDIFPNGEYIIGGGYYSGGGPVLFRLDTQGVVLWDTIVAGIPSSDWRFVYVEVTNDDGFLALDSKGYLYKFNFANTLLWTLNTSCITLVTNNSKLIETNDGYVITGFSSSGVGLVKVTPNGAPVFAKRYTNPLSSYTDGLGLKQTSDGGYIISGIYHQTSPYGTFVYLIKTDSAGTLQWAKTYDSPATNDYGTDVLLADDGGYFICDGIRNGNNEKDICIIKTDSSGNIQWANKYDLGSYSYAYYLLHTNDNKIIVTGNASKPMMMKIDTNGNWIWSHEYPVGGGKVVRETNDGGFAVAGSAPGGYGSIHCFIKTDSLGDVLGACPDSSLPAPLIQNIINSYTVTSAPNNVTNNITVSPITATLGDDPLIRTVYCNVVSLSSETILPDNNVVTIFPNPFTTSTTLQITNDKLRMTNLDLKIYNMFGQEVHPSVIRNSEGFVIRKCNLSGGIYVYEVIGEDGVVGKGKLVVE